MIDDLTIKEARELAKFFQRTPTADSGPWVVGEVYLIRCVTHYLVGRVVGVGQQELELEDAAWVADTGRFSEALRTGKLAEVEPCPNGKWIVGRGAVVDAGPWVHGLLREVVQ
jgi:hypothetical protein